VPVEVKTTIETIKEVHVTEQVPVVTEKLVHVSSPEMVTIKEKVVDRVVEIPKEIVREIAVQQPVCVEISREVPVTVREILEVERVREKVVQVETQSLKPVEVLKIVEKDVPVAQVFELTKVCFFQGNQFTTWLMEFLTWLLLSSGSSG